MKIGRVRDALRIVTGKLPGQLVIQITNHCNAACPQCGMRKSARIERRSIAADKIKETVRQCADNGFEAVSFTGGEPFINMDALVDLLDYASDAGIPYLRTGTNGYMLAGASSAQIAELADRLAATKVRNFWISLDSADTATHETMRGLPGVVDGIRRALPVFHERSVYPAVNLGINRKIMGEPIPRLTEGGAADFLQTFKAGFAAFFETVIALGFTMANVCYPMSSAGGELETPAYGAISDDFCVSFSEEELRLVFRALMETIPAYREKIRIFTPLSVLYAMSHGNGELLYPCLGGVRYFYMDSRDGHVYPCGYLGEKDMGGDLAAAAQLGGRCKPHCKRCHWECFRDPSQLFGIARHIIRHPARAILGRCIDPVMRKLWFGDLKYYIRHDFFNGRVAPRFREGTVYENAKPYQNRALDLSKNA